MNNNRFNLTEREQEVLTLLAEGLSTSQIASKLFLSIHTIKAHFHHLFQKFGLDEYSQNQRETKRIALLILAYKYGYINLERIS